MIRDCSELSAKVMALNEEIIREVTSGLIEQAMDAIRPEVEQRVVQMVREMEPFVLAYMDMIRGQAVLEVSIKQR